LNERDAGEVGGGQAGGLADAGGSMGGGVATPRIGLVQVTPVDATARFGLRSSVLTSPGCATTTVSGCDVHACQQPTDGGVIPDFIFETDNAGSLELKNERTGSSAMFQKSSDKYGAQFGVGFFQTGDSVTLMGSGAAVPAFGPLSATVPQNLALIAPTRVGAGPYQLARNSPLQLVWANRGEGLVRVRLSSRAEGLTVQIRCVFPVSIGSGTIPADVMSLLPVSTSSGDFFADATSERSTVVADYEIRLTVITPTSAGGRAEYR
jgi:hypothetical protein